MSEKKPFFDEVKRERTLLFLNEKWKNKICECCGASSWTLAADIVSTPIMQESLVLGGPTYPYVIATCLNCSNTKFFNAVIAGALEQKAENEK